MIRRLRQRHRLMFGVLAIAMPALMITGLMARGFSPMQAAETAAYLHVECALEFGPGLIAEDLPEQIPAVFRKLGM